MSMRRRRFKQELPLEERLAQEAKTLREKAKTLRPGTKRDMLLRKAQQDETAAHLTKWLTSPRLWPPVR